jgi:site-specific DNA recombinase
MKAAIYARVSTSDKQDYNRQIDELTILAKEQGYLEIDVYAESLSGFKKADSRPELTKLLKNATKYHIIYTSEISRIGRNPTETRRILDELTDLGIPVFIQSLKEATLDKNGKRNLTMNIICQVLIEYAKLEDDTFKTRSKSGLLASAKRGKAGGSNNFPFGYTKDEKGMLVIQPNEVDTVKEIFNLYKAGNGIKVISNILNEKGILTRTNKLGKVDVKWVDKTIHDILRNTLYIGQRRFKEHVLDAPSIIDESLFNQCKEIMTGKTHRNYLTTYTYLLKDLCTCGHCQRNYFAKYKPKEEEYYMCSSRLKKNGNCGNIGINIPLLESAIYDILVKTDAVLKYLNNSNELKATLGADITRLKADLQVEEKVTKTKEREKEKLLDLYLSGSSISKTIFDTRNTKIENELTNSINRVIQLKRSISEKESALISLDSVKATKQMLLDARNDRTALQAIFKQFIQKVIVGANDGKVAYITLEIAINGVFIDQGYLLLDIKSIKQSKKTYRYKSVYINQEEKFDNDSLEDRFEMEDWVILEEKDLLQVENKKPLLN